MRGTLMKDGRSIGILGQLSTAAALPWRTGRRYRAIRANGRDVGVCMVLLKALWILQWAELEDKRTGFGG